MEVGVTKGAVMLIYYGSNWGEQNIYLGFEFADDLFIMEKATASSSKIWCLENLMKYFKSKK